MQHNIPIACADFSFPLLSHDVALNLIAGMGIDAVDVSLMVGYSHFNVPEVLKHPGSAGRALSRLLSSKGLKVADINFAPGEDFETRALNHPDPAARRESWEWYERTIEFAAQAGARHMTILPGQQWQLETPESSLDRCIAELAARLEYAETAGIVLSIEPHLGSIVPTPSAVSSLLAAVPKLTLTLDYTHFIYQGFTDDECAELLPFSTHFHARGGAPKRLQTSLSKSTIDYRAVLKRMIEAKYRGYFAIEYVWMDWEGCNETDNVSETMLMRRLAREVIESHR